jgi:light-regulated signal transduction histidine kinase (bacteriophytochrome)
MDDLTDAHELLIAEHEILERDYERLKLAKARSEAKLKRDNFELRTQLRAALAEIEELQDLLERSYVKT